MDNYSKSDLEDLLDGIPISLWLKNAEGQYIYVNKCFCDSVEMKKEDILGKKLSELTVNTTSDFFESSDKEILENNTPQYSENEISLGKTVKWIESFKNCINRSSTNEPIIVGISHDISLKKEKELIKDSHFENQLQIILDTAADVYCILEYNGKFKKVNERFCKTFGWSESELYLLMYKDLIHPDDIGPSAEFRQTALEQHISKGYGLVNRYCCKDGSYKYFRWNWNVMKSNNNDIILTGIDVTKEIELKEKQEELQKSYQLETLKTNFFANISHEFRTPINIILTSIQLLLSMNENCNCNINKDKFKKYCTGIKQNSYRLLRLVNNLLEMTKMGEGYCELKPINCNIVNLIENIVLSVADHIENRKRQIIFDTTEEDILTACDPDKIETIMLNLLSNSVKFTKDNGIIEVNISHDYAKSEVKVSVKDNGKSIDSKYSKVIFEPFTQIDDLLSRPCEGSGLGLALVKSLVDSHKGHIWANTDCVKGAEIIFTLPITKCSVSQTENYTTKTLGANIERFNVEFSDIYNLT